MVRMYKVSKEAAGKEEEEQQKMMQKDMATFLEGAWYAARPHTAHAQQLLLPYRVLKCTHG